MRHWGMVMSLSDAASAASPDERKVWREIRSRLLSLRNEPKWLSSGHRRTERRLCRLLIVEMQRDQRSAARNR
jgi:hypothetical protein